MLSEQQILNRVQESLIKDYGYSREQIETEVDIGTGNGQRLRADIVVFKTTEKNNPMILIETKKRLLLPAMITQLEQYMEATKAEYGMITDGFEKYCIRNVLQWFIQTTDIPKSGEELPEIPNKSQLLPPSDIIFKLWIIGDFIRNSKTVRSPLDEINKLLLCKIADEKSSEKKPKFWISTSEIRESKSLDQFLSRMNDLLESASGSIDLDQKQRFLLEPELLQASVAELQTYSITESPMKVLMSYSDWIVQSNKHAKDGAEFFTPPIVSDLIVKLLAPNSNHSFLDPACGVGDILREVLKGIQKQTRSKKAARKYSEALLYGAERNYSTSIIAKTALMMIGLDSANIIVEDSLQPGGQIDESMKKLGGVDRIGTFPPMGVRVTSRAILDKSQVALGKTTSTNTGLFIEKAQSWLKDSGQMAIVVPEGFLFSGSEISSRYYILQNFRVKAIIGLPSGSLQPYSGAKISMLLLEKSAKKPDLDYPVFIASLDAMHKTKVEEKASEVVKHYQQFLKGKVIEADGIFLIESAKLWKEQWSTSYYASQRMLGALKGVALSEIGTIFTGFSISSREYLKDIKKGVPYIRIGNLSEGSISSEGLKYVRAESAPEKKRLKYDDVLVSLTGTIGKVSIVSPDMTGSIPSSLVAVIRCDSKRVRPKYLHHVLSSKQIQNLLGRLDTGSLISHLRISELRNIRIPVPSLDKQDAIIDRLNKLEIKKKKQIRERQRIEEELKKLQEGVWDEY